MVVGKAFGVSLGSGRMAELNVGEFFRSLNHERFMPEAVRKYYVATLIRKVSRSVIASRGFVNGIFEDHLIVGKTEGLLNFFCRVHEVQVVSGLVIVKENETDFDVGIINGLAVVCRIGLLGAGGRCCVISVLAARKREERTYHDCRKAKSKNLFAHSTAYLLKKEKNVIYRMRGFPHRHIQKIKNRRTAVRYTVHERNNNIPFA